MKSCLFILVAVGVLAGLVISLGTVFLMSEDTQVVEPAKEEQLEE